MADTQHTEHTAEDAYRKGWEASKRTTTYDLEAAESRYERRYGSQWSAEFSDGWTDYAADHPYGHSLEHGPHSTPDEEGERTHTERQEDDEDAAFLAGFRGERTTEPETTTEPTPEDDVRTVLRELADARNTGDEFRMVELSDSLAWLQERHKLSDEDMVRIMDEEEDARTPDLPFLPMDNPFRNPVYAVAMLIVAASGGGWHFGDEPETDDLEDDEETDEEYDEDAATQYRTLLDDRYEGEASSYGWKLDRVNTEFLDKSEVGTVGPRNISVGLSADLENGLGRTFRMYDDDGEWYYTGRLVWVGTEPEGDDEFGPLWDYGTPNAGATEIRYRSRTGGWVTL